MVSLQAFPVRAVMAGPARSGGNRARAFPRHDARAIPARPGPQRGGAAQFLGGSTRAGPAPPEGQCGDPGAARSRREQV